MRISDWSSDVCSSDLRRYCRRPATRTTVSACASPRRCSAASVSLPPRAARARSVDMKAIPKPRPDGIVRFGKRKAKRDDRNLMFAALLKPPPALPVEYDFDVAHHGIRSEEHTSELQSLMR